MWRDQGRSGLDTSRERFGIASEGVDGFESGHHLDQRVLGVRNLIEGREDERHAPSPESLGELGAHDVSQGHRRGPDVEANDLEPPADRLESRRDGLVSNGLAQFGELGQRSDQRHQVGLAGSVRADDERAQVVAGCVEPEVRDHPVDKLGGHPVRDDVGLDIASGYLDGVGVADLLDGLEWSWNVDDVAVLHAGNLSSR